MREESGLAEDMSCCGCCSDGWEEFKKALVEAFKRARDVVARLWIQIRRLLQRHSRLIDGLVGAVAIVAAVAAIVGTSVAAGPALAIIASAVALAAAVVKLVKSARGSAEYNLEEQTMHASLQEIAQSRLNQETAMQNIIEDLQSHARMVLEGTRLGPSSDAAEAAASRVAQTSVDEHLSAARDHLRSGRGRANVSGAIEMQYKR